MDHFSLFLSKQDLLVTKLISKFVDKEIMPFRDKIDDDAEHTIIQTIFRKINQIGFDGGRFLLDSFKQKEKRSSFLTSSLIIEELSRGDAGIGIVSSINGWALLPAYLSDNQAVFDLYEKFVKKQEPVFNCFAMTESDSGCDIENLPLQHGRTIRTTAALKDGYWEITGNKVFASNAAISSLYCVLCRVEGTVGEDGLALIYVPENTKGMSFGKFEKKAGLQADRNANIYFDHVRVPENYRAAGAGDDVLLLKTNIAAGRVATAAAAVGTARGALDEVMRYTGERIVGNKPVRNHSSAACILADMITGIETSRTFYLQTAYMLDRPDEFGLRHSGKILSYASMCKNYAAETAVSITNKAMELMGSYGYIRDYHLEKYWRDVKELQLWLGGSQLGRFDVVRAYYQYE